ERERWAASGLASYISEPEPSGAESSEDTAIPEGCIGVPSPITASVWNIAVEPGQHVEAGQKLLVLEAMKMEIAVVSPGAGIIERISCSPGSLVSAGQS